MMIKSKVLTSTVMLMAVLGLAGCANANTSAPSSSSSKASSAKVVKDSGSKKATGEKASMSSGQTSSSSVVTSPATDTSVLQKFFAASGVSQANGDSYLVTPKADGSYQVEIRNNGGDPQVASLVGMYQYNPTTNQVQKMNIVTGQYE